MSSILKALRKLEEEKAVRREGGFDIARDILRTSSGRRAVHSWRFSVTILMAVLLFGWGGYRLSSPSAPAPPTVPARGARPLPAVVPADIPLPPASLRPRTVAAEPPIVEEVIESDIPASFPVQTRSRPLPAVPPAPQAQTGIQNSPPALLLSDIVYHDNPDARLAVINDLPVMLGTAVGEAVVEEILRDRVRLAKNGKSFEVRLTPNP